ncbi:hypothetical protein [Fusobacterium sp. PH5-44]|uniref:hypothetical protein n=1 Tax=unclassified Fusobacterium TaxID=2648384 RepID=UPI003D19B1CE
MSTFYMLGIIMILIIIFLYIFYKKKSIKNSEIEKKELLEKIKSKNLNILNNDTKLLSVNESFCKLLDNIYFQRLKEWTNDKSYKKVILNKKRSVDENESKISQISYFEKYISYQTDISVETLKESISLFLRNDKEKISQLYDEKNYYLIESYDDGILKLRIEKKQGIIYDMKIYYSNGELMYEYFLLDSGYVGLKSYDIEGKHVKSDKFMYLDNKYFAALFYNRIPLSLIDMLILHVLIGTKNLHDKITKNEYQVSVDIMTLADEKRDEDIFTVGNTKFFWLIVGLIIIFMILHLSIFILVL